MSTDGANATNLGWHERSRAAVWHPCTQMKEHERAPLVAIARGRGAWLYDYDGNCPFTDPETGDQIPGRDCRYNFVFDWTFVEPCTGSCTCVTCCGNGTIRIDGQNYPSGTTQGISIWAALTCGSGAQQLFFPVQCVGNMQTTTMLNPGYNVTCGSCN